MKTLYRPDLFSVAGRIACVTGASSGIGRAIASALAEAGAHVVGVARRVGVLEEWCDEVDGETAVVAADLSNTAEVEAVTACIAQPFGAPDILINAAGINPREPADTVTTEGWRITIDLNLAAPFFLARALVPAMRDKGWGRIVNLASLQSARAFPAGLAYGASKGGIAQLTRAMAEAWSRDGIAVNAIAPGFFPTGLTAPVFDDPTLAAKHAAQTCIARNGVLADLVGPALFLCSDAADYVTGQVLYVDGGYTAK
ncbi:MAG: SDR family oxidoreductase [Alphaproteobacteria bacterium]|nr:SDR family oxidoreductase [Alphaproteobacteria bacterium]MCY4229876.1 SDR family oxidoreductase [Alphaproteobacteria bacterium]MCY4320065.1 SDR family oxidoreductase [Alphaproteobacteria bacterium]